MNTVCCFDKVVGCVIYLTLQRTPVANKYDKIDNNPHDRRIYKAGLYCKQATTVMRQNDHKGVKINGFKALLLRS